MQTMMNNSNQLEGDALIRHAVWNDSLKVVFDRDQLTQPMCVKDWDIKTRLGGTEIFHPNGGFLSSRYAAVEINFEKASGNYSMKIYGNSHCPFPVERDRPVIILHRTKDEAWITSANGTEKLLSINKMNEQDYWKGSLNELHAFISAIDVFLNGSGVDRAKKINIGQHPKLQEYPEA